MTLILFFYGLPFFMLGVATLCALVLQPRSRLEISQGVVYLGAFGLLHGATEWCAMLDHIGASIGGWALIPLVMSFIALLAYGAGPIVQTLRARRALWVTIAAVAVAIDVLAVRSPEAPFAEIAARYFLGIPAAAMVARRLWRERTPRNTTSGRQVRVLAITFAFYGLVACAIVPAAPVFPASFLNQQLFHAYFGFPIQIVRGAAAMVIMTCIIAMLRMFKDEIFDGLRSAIEQRTQSEERHRALFDACPLPTWVIDATTRRFIAVNEAMVRHYGYSRDELLAMHVTELEAEPHDTAQMLDIIDEGGGDVIHVGVQKHRRKDGTSLDLDVTMHGIMFGNRAVLGIGHDLTEARKLESQLRHAQKMEAIGELAGGIAHDFNNMLAVILANAELAIEEVTCSGGAARALSEITNAAERAATLTRQLLTFSRKDVRKRQRIALDAVVESTQAMLECVVGDSISVVTHHPADLDAVEADPHQIEQIITNLVLNARDAMPTGGELTIETANVVVDAARAAELGVSPGAYVMLAAHDTGCGMSPAVRARVFEPFFTTKDVGRGTGLGLAMVFGIVKQSRGAITVDSDVGRGTSFRIYLPRAVERPSSSTAAIQRLGSTRGSGTVLVVEDDAQLRAVMVRHIMRSGYTVLEAPDGKAALVLVRQHVGRIDLVLTDLVMPELDGHALARHVRELRPATRIVFMSGYTQHTALSEKTIGPEDVFVEKPFSLQTLSELIAAEMSKLRARRSASRITRSTEGVAPSTA